MNNKILITGATGSLGSMLINLLKEKIEITNLAVLVRDEKNELAKQYAYEGIEVLIGDYANLESLERAFKDIDTLYFVSGGDDNERAKLHKNVVDSAKKNGIKHILYTSAVWKDESDSSPLANLVDSHLQTENCIKTSGITYTILKHNLYAEVIEMMIGDKSQLLKTKNIYLPTANGLTSFVPKKDLAEVEVNILLNPSSYSNKTLEFNGSEQISFSEIAKKISEIIKEPIQYISPTENEFKEQMTKFGLPSHIIEILKTFSTAIANREFDQQSNDLERVLGRKTTSLSEFLQRISNVNSKMLLKDYA
ncbi:SDR family oxidoreductase [Flavobacterium sinopsychrotolerans]|uniref:NAD(P)H dehydrogenase (Quinone) n=1 Tax=Flavobacterium sinopsychrotolerans TaxID=604089 RepID=A0A1H8RT56_9FLAO|nr:SDR family oxidoreductase [Flavobacterium sinopsychrotolerans]SEO69550.1 NAD(P)H dehydrogenase (quinone) [Flavobacterium sinopsychrotolerans]